MYSSTREFEACVCVNNKPVTEIVHNGYTYIEGRKNSSYELHFKNKTANRVLIVPSVDGLNVLDGLPCGVYSPGYVVEGFDSIIIPGWKVDGKTAAEFIFRPQGARYKEHETYVEAIGQDPTNQGVIGFMVFYEKKKLYYDPSPWNSHPWGTHPWEPHPRRSFNHNSTTAVPPNTWEIDITSNSVGSGVYNAHGNLGTGFGDPTHFETVSTTFERSNPNNPDVVFVFYYDTLNGLKERGVPIHLFKNYSKTVSTDPNPFPNSPSVINSGCIPPPDWNRLKRKKNVTRKNRNYSK
jgi:hypothetical protein